MITDFFTLVGFCTIVYFCYKYGLEVYNYLKVYYVDSTKPVVVDVKDDKKVEAKKTAKPTIINPVKPAKPDVKKEEVKSVKQEKTKKENKKTNNKKTTDKKSTKTTKKVTKK